MRCLICFSIIWVTRYSRGSSQQPVFVVGRAQGLLLQGRVHLPIILASCNVARNAMFKVLIKDVESWAMHLCIFFLFHYCIFPSFLSVLAVQCSVFFFLLDIYHVNFFCFHHGFEILNGFEKKCLVPEEHCKWILNLEQTWIQSCLNIPIKGRKSEEKNNTAHST